MQKMINAFKTFRTQSPVLISLPPLLTPSLCRKVSGVRFKQSTTLNSCDSEAESKRSINMEDKREDNNPVEKSGDFLSDSFGVGYSTRCDDDGFGGICGGNQSIPKTEQAQVMHENHPAFDNSQGSEVKEEEKARRQTDASS